MKNVKRLISIVLTLLLSVSLLAGCGSSSSETDSSKGKKKVIGVCMENFSDQFQVYVMDGMKKEQAKYQDLDVIYMDAKADGQKQISQVENLITQQVDAIILYAVDDNTANTVVKEINDAKIPLIAVNRALPKQELANCFVGSDDVQAGETQMKEMAKELNGKGNIVVLDGVMGTPPQIKRGQGYQNILKDNPDMKITAEQTGEWTRDKGMKIMEDWIQSGKKIDAVVSNNDEMALGAAKAINDSGLKGKIKVAGIDATPEALNAIKDGELSFTVYQDANGQGAKSVESAYKIIKGENVDKQVIIPFQLVTPDKVDQYLKK